MEFPEVLRELRRIRLERSLSYRALAALVSGEAGGDVSYSTLRGLLESSNPAPFETTKHVVCSWVEQELKRERRRKRTGAARRSS